jgi:hypothetical protein
VLSIVLSGISDASIQSTDTDKMKQNYDFSKGERGKFYRSDAVYHIPIYLDTDVEEAMQVLAERTGQDISVLVNGWLRKNIDIVHSVQPSPNP